MKTKRVTENIHATMLECGKYGDILSEIDSLGIEFEFKLADRMEERNVSVRQLAHMTGLRLATISDLMTGKRYSINLTHVALLMYVLRITEVSELINVHIPNDVKVNMDRDSYRWRFLEETPNIVTENPDPKNE